MQAAGGAGPRQTAPPPLQPSPEIVEQLVAMGFSENGSKRATLAMHASHRMARWLVCLHLQIMWMPAPLHSNCGVWRRAQAACSSASSWRQDGQLQRCSCPVLLQEVPE